MRLADRALGALGLAMVAAAVYLMVAGLVRSDPSAESPPAVSIDSPANGEVIQNALVIRFTTGEPLSMMPGGWGANGFHMHAEIGGQEIMPGPQDIRVLPQGGYSWTIRNAPAGESIIRLFWSTSEHVPVAGGGSQAVTVVLPRSVDRPQSPPGTE